MSKKWGSTNSVRERILDGAMSVFKTKGYDAATMTDIVSEAEASIGSIYHHFGGKEEMFAACYSRCREDIRSKVGIAPGETMPAVGSWERAYLWAVWMAREDASVFLGLDVPAGFDRAAKVADYYRQALGEYTSRLLGALMAEAMRIIVECQRDEAGAVIDHAVDFIVCLEDTVRTDF